MRSREIYGDNRVPTRGFTLVELLITIAILGVVTASGIGLLSRYTETTQLEDAQTQVSQALRIAYTRAHIGMNQSVHGVYIEPHRFTLFQGSSYVGRDQSYDRVVRMKDALTLSASFPGNTIVFTSLSAAPSATGTITISHSVYGQDVVYVNELGLIE